jgi:hypothetical protein
MESIIREKQRRSDNKSEKSMDPVIANISESLGTCLIRCLNGTLLVLQFPPVVTLDQQEMTLILDL